MVRTKHTALYKGTNPKLEKVKTILKYAKALEKLIIMFQSEELLNQNDNDNNIINQLSPIINNTSAKRRGRPRAKALAKEGEPSCPPKKDNNINNKEVKEDKEEDKLIKKFDEKVKIDYTGISELMNENKDCDIELK